MEITKKTVEHQTIHTITIELDEKEYKAFLHILTCFEIRPSDFCDYKKEARDIQTQLRDKLDVK
jgi:hypothetical protein